MDETSPHTHHNNQQCEDTALLPHAQDVEPKDEPKTRALDETSQSDEREMFFFYNKKNLKKIYILYYFF